MYSGRDDAALPAPGCPIRESTGQRLFNTSPWLIAVVHALHRLLMPRHPPCALNILTVITAREPEQTTSGVYAGRPELGDTQFMPGASTPDMLANCAVFKVRQRTRHGLPWPVRSGPTRGLPAERPARGRSLKTQQHVLLNRLSAFDQARSTC